MDKRDEIPRSGEIVSFRNNGCFVCGPENPIGLRCVFTHDGENRRATTSVTFRKDHQGWDGIVHGGLLVSVLDDVMDHAILSIGKLGLTTHMNITFRKAVKTGEEVRFEGEIIELKSRTARTHAIGYSSKNGDSGEKEIFVEAEGVYFLDSPEKTITKDSGE